MSLGKRLISTDSAGGVVGTDNFNTVLYTGNGSTQPITGVGFQPDLVWNKIRSTAGDHNLTDSVRGAQKALNSNLTSAEANQSPLGITFQSNGFTAIDNSGGGAGVNGSGRTYVAWCWKGGGSASSNSNGSIPSQVSANPAAGFSIATYTGNNTQNATVGHGLGIEPKLVIIKRLDVPNSWWIPLPILGSNQFMEFSTAAATTDSQYQYTQTTDIFKFTSSSQSAQYNASGGSYVMYSFADITGYQKVGTYVATGSAGSPIVTTGFQPRFVMVKNLDKNQEWIIVDSARNNGANSLRPDGGAAENTVGDNAITLNSDGFTIAVSGSGVNYQSGDDFLYLAIA